MRSPVGRGHRLALLLAGATLVTPVVVPEWAGAHTVLAAECQELLDVLGSYPTRRFLVPAEAEGKLRAAALARVSADPARYGPMLRPARCQQAQRLFGTATGRRRIAEQLDRRYDSMLFGSRCERFARATFLTVRTELAGLDRALGADRFTPAEWRNVNRLWTSTARTAAARLSTGCGRALRQVAKPVR